MKDKLDVDKDRWDLLPTRALREVVRVFTFGAKKYSDHGWKTVPGARERYYAALLRHVTAWFEGERIDSETGLPHLAHAGCCVLILLAFESGDAEPLGGIR